MKIGAPSKPITITWTEWFPQASHSAEVVLVKVEDLGTFKGRSLGRYEVRHGVAVIGTVESKDERLYRQVGRCSNPSGRAVRWSFNVSAPWPSSNMYGFGYRSRADALVSLCEQAVRAGVMLGTAITPKKRKDKSQ